MRYCHIFTGGGFRGRTTHFVSMLLFNVMYMTAVVPFVSVHSLGNYLSFVMVYVWSRHSK